MGGGKSKKKGWPDLPEPLPAPVTDNHTHLPLIDESGRPLDEDDVALPPGEAPLSTAQQIDLARSVGVTRLLSVGCDVPSLRGTVALARAHPEIAAAVAIHPNEAPLHAGVREMAPDGLDPAQRAHHEVPLEQAIAQVAELARDPRVVAVGETGLDYFRTGERGRVHQIDAFRQHIALAKELGKPLQIHDRDAHHDVVEILLADGAPERTVFHCYSGDAEMATILAEQGWYASIAGPVTFGKNEAGREALRALPRDLVLVETDAPYLTPAPYRGRPNASYVMPLTVRAIAEQWAMAEGEQAGGSGPGIAETCRILAANTEAVYGTW
ncbi:TatD family hydrolase [Bogoriella caseilytica]|uniref:TatD DNase family protein n=1 Tax=Bogoriella caseilytica TaxID=56055 RepID=A0A3N2BAG4_9MICO|nr:TatD family hydrolase [Bogoriella caseilytica]ROR72263.1 TatD DNase family protein [Bogoriella caseilytica]